MSQAASLHLSGAFGAGGDKLPDMRIDALVNLVHRTAPDHLAVEYHADSIPNFTRTRYVVGNGNHCRARQDCLPGLGDICRLEL